jgi:hypothetical protein
MMEDRFLKRLRKKAQMGHMGWPIGRLRSTVYGPNLSQATKVVCWHRDLRECRGGSVTRLESGSRTELSAPRRVYAMPIRLIVHIMTKTRRESRSSPSFPLRRLYPRARPVNRSVSARTKPTIDQLRRDQCIQNGVRCRSACWRLRITALQTPSGTHPHFRSQHSTGHGQITKLHRSLTHFGLSRSIFGARERTFHGTGAPNRGVRI